MSPSVRPTTTVRLVFLGAAGVGKSALICRFLHDRFEHKYTRTVEELHALEFDTIGDAGIRLEVLDTSGNEAIKPSSCVDADSHSSFSLNKRAIESFYLFSF
uniref:Uncharacterized protein n=1 Tax=Myripristis murdjan TaxID=586833 RepID=A0A667WXA3_9TELE